MTRVLNARFVGRNCPGAVYVGRPSKWGNPFIIGKDGTRGEVIKAYEDRLLRNPGMLWLCQEELRGKDLICWCAPEACHADILIKYAN